MDIPSISLPNEVAIPQIGLGLWKVTDRATFNTMFDAAIEAGYTHFDTAQAYHNESYLGAAIKRHTLDRSAVFVTTKIAVQHFRKKRLRQSFEASLRDLQTDHVDLLLLHFPVPLLRSGAWAELEALAASGQATNIGVSNFTINHLEKLATHAGLTPAVNQVELHVFLQQPELIKYCQNHHIVVEAYSPLAHSRSMDNPVITRIAKKHKKSYAQVMLAWCTEQGLVVIPKSVTPSRLIENIDIFDFHLDLDDMRALTQENRNLRTCWNPTRVP